MEIFLKKIFFLLLPFSLIIVMEITFEFYPHTYNTKAKHLHNSMEEISILFIGTSHTQNAINPEYIDQEAANLGFAGQDLQTSYALLENYIPKLSNLKYLGIEISYHSLELKNRPDYWRNSFYYRFFDLENLHPEHYQLKNEVLSLTNFHYFFKNFIRFINPWNETKNYNEYGFPNSDIEGRFLRFQYGQDAIFNSYMNSKRIFRHSDTDIEAYRQNIHIVDKIINLAEDHNINIFFYDTPLYTTYRACMIREKLNRRDTMIDNLETDGFHFLNFSSCNNFSVKEYKDDDHLNSLGARRFTKMMNDSINLLDNRLLKTHTSNQP